MFTITFRAVFFFFLDERVPRDSRSIDSLYLLFNERQGSVMFYCQSPTKTGKQTTLKGSKQNAGEVVAVFAHVDLATWGVAQVERLIFVRGGQFSMSTPQNTLRQRAGATKEPPSAALGDAHAKTKDGAPRREEIVWGKTPSGEGKL